MNIELSEEQFETLMVMVEAGSWLINSPKTDRIDRFDEIASLIFSHAGEADLEDHVFYDEEENRYYPDGNLEEKIMKFVNDYENDAFWDLLISRLAMRDIREEYDEETVENMETREWIEARHEHEQPYAEEFSEHGIERLTVDQE